MTAIFEGSEVLIKAASEGTLGDSEWAEAFPSILQRLHHNIYHEFPTPSDTSSRHPQEEQSQSQSQAVASTNTAIPSALQSSHDYIRTSLTSNFTSQPPHTIQRLAELILYPRQHHRFLHAYLNALDRVVSVYSGLNSLLPHTNDTALVNGAHAENSLTSDESLGGALLTPIPWLRELAIEGGSLSPPPAGVTSTPESDTSSTTSGVATPESASTESTAPPERSDGAITQGELLRQEQRASSPPAPIASLGVGRQLSPDIAATLTAEPEEEPHARGPETIGPEDTGPQPGTSTDTVGVGADTVLDMAAAVGRARASRSPEAPPIAVANQASDSDGDVELVDADGVPTDQERRNEGSGAEHSTAPGAAEGPAF